MFQDVIILAGGFGTRLKSVVSDRPKPLAEIQQLPFLWYILRRLYRYNIQRIHLSVGYMADHIEQFLKDYQIHYWFDSIQLIYEKKPLGTGGALINTLHTIDSTLPILLLNGDTFLDINYYDLWQCHLRYNAHVTLSLFQQNNHNKRYGHVFLDPNNRIVFDAKESSSPNTLDSSWINAGVYVIDPVKIISQIPCPSVPFHFDKEFLIPFHPYLKVFGYQCFGKFIDIGYPVDYYMAQSIYFTH